MYFIVHTPSTINFTKGPDYAQPEISNVILSLTITSYQLIIKSYTPLRHTTKLKLLSFRINLLQYLT